MTGRHRSATAEARRFALVATVLLSAAAAWGLLTGRSLAGWGLLAAGAAIATCALAAPTVWLRAFRAWMRFALALGAVLTAVVLGVVFLAVLTPIGLARRLVGRAGIDRSWRREDGASMWVDKESPEPTLERYEKPY